MLKWIVLLLSWNFYSTVFATDSIVVASTQAQFMSLEEIDQYINTGKVLEKRGHVLLFEVDGEVPWKLIIRNQKKAMVIDIDAVFGPMKFQVNDSTEPHFLAIEKKFASDSSQVLEIILKDKNYWAKGFEYDDIKVIVNVEQLALLFYKSVKHHFYQWSTTEEPEETIEQQDFSFHSDTLIVSSPKIEFEGSKTPGKYLKKGNWWYHLKE